MWQLDAQSKKKRKTSGTYHSVVVHGLDFLHSENGTKRYSVSCPDKFFENCNLERLCYDKYY